MAVQCFWPRQIVAVCQVLHDTQGTTAQVSTIRLKVLKVGVRVRETVCLVWLHLRSAHPLQGLWFLYCFRAYAPCAPERRSTRQTTLLRPLPPPTVPAEPPIRCIPSNKQYLGNTNNIEVHNLLGKTPECPINEILQAGHAVIFAPDTLDQAHQEGYDNCAYCIGGSLR